MREVLAFFYPTTVLMLDDNASFLKSVIAILDDSRFHYKPFDSPHFALDFLNNLYKSPIKTQQYIRPYGETITVSVLPIIYNFSRFISIATLLTDYEMPGINGVEFCDAIKPQQRIDCIMLTGVATSALANRAMDGKIISHFVKKNDVNFAQNVMKIISDSQIEFFKKATKELKDLCQSLKINLFINEPVYKQFFNEQILSQNFSEYYLLDECGSYLIVKKDKSFSAVFVWNKNESDKIFNTFKGKYELSVLNKIVSGENIICFPYKNGTVESFDISVFIKPAKKYNDEISYVYVEDASYLVKAEHITFFDEYKSKIAFSEQHFSTLFNM